MNHYLDPTALNSNLFPVKANGEVLFLSDGSRGIAGRAFTPNWTLLGSLSILVGRPPFAVAVEWLLLAVVVESDEGRT